MAKPGALPAPPAVAGRPPAPAARLRGGGPRLHGHAHPRGGRAAAGAPSSRQHKVEFAGRIETTFWKDLLFGWVIPLGVMVAIWMFLMRRVGGGPTQALSFGRTKHKIYDRKELKTTFEDVAGVDEAKAELIEIVDFLKNPEKYQRLGGRIPKGVLLVGPAGHRQDAAGPGGGRRGRRAVLHAVRLGVRGDVRGRGRRPRARPLRAGQGQGALHHLHRRAGRHRQVARGRHRLHGRPRRARADAQPAPGRDGRLRLLQGRHHHGRHQPARGARPGAAAAGPLRPPGGGRPARRPRPRGDPAAARPRRGAGARASTWRSSPPARPASPAPTWPTSSTRPPCSPRARRRTRSRWPTSRRRSTGSSPGSRRRAACSREKERDIVAHHEMGHALVAVVAAPRRPGAQGHDHPARRGRARHDLPAAARGPLPLTRASWRTGSPCSWAAGWPRSSSTARSRPAPTTTSSAPPSWRG